MKAVVISRYGDIGGLEYRDVPDPTPGPGDLLVRVRATALNRADILQRRGQYPPPAPAPIEIPGLEFAGDVEVAGEEVERFRQGDRVMGLTASGAHATRLVVPAALAIPMPASLSWQEAAAIPEAFITAHDALSTQCRLQRGESVLIHAAGSGIGVAAVQIARECGAMPIIGTAGSQEKLMRARGLGLHTAVNYREQDFVDAVREATARRGVDVILDLVGSSYFERNLEAAAVKGRMIVVGLLSGSSTPLDLRILMMKRLTIRGTVLRSRSIDEKAEASRSFARDVLPLIRERKIEPVIDRVFRLSEIQQAHLYMESNANFGKIVLDPD